MDLLRQYETSLRSLEIEGYDAVDVEKIRVMLREQKTKMIDLCMQINTQIDKCNSIIQSLCDHNKVPDRSDYDPCRTYYVCSKCGVKM